LEEQDTCKKKKSILVVHPSRNAVAGVFRKKRNPRGPSGFQSKEKKEDSRPRETTNFSEPGFSPAAPKDRRQKNFEDPTKKPTVSDFHQDKSPKGAKPGGLKGINVGRNSLNAERGKSESQKSRKKNPNTPPV